METLRHSEVIDSKSSSCISNSTATIMASFLKKKRNIRLAATSGDSGNSSSVGKIMGQHEEKDGDRNGLTAARQDSNDRSSEVKANKMQKSIGSNRFNKNSKRLFPRPVVQ